MEKLSTPAQRYTEHIVTFQGSVGLPGTGDPLKMKKSHIFLRVLGINVYIKILFEKDLITNIVFPLGDILRI